MAVLFLFACTTKNAGDPGEPVRRAKSSEQANIAPTAPREPPQFVADFTGLELSEPFDFGDGWLVFGIDPDSGEVRSGWYPDAGKPNHRDAVVVQEDVYCDQDLGVRTEILHGRHFVFWVDCMSGEDILRSRSTAYVFSDVAPFAGLDPIAAKWSGVVTRTGSNEVLSCRYGNGGKLEVRGDEVWLVTKPWLEEDEGTEHDCEIDAPVQQRLF